MSDKTMSEQQDFQLRYFVSVDTEKYVNGMFIAFSEQEAEKYSRDEKLFELNKSDFESVGPNTQYSAEKLTVGLVKIGAPTTEDNKFVKESLLSKAALKVVGWQTKLLLGRKLSATEENSLNSWLDYMDMLQSIDTSSKDDLEWPQEPSS